MKTKSKRLANIELLRIIAMLMVIMLHYLGKGGLLPDMSLNMGINGYVAWILETLSNVAVNVYVLISGYFLVESEFKFGKVINLVLQVFFYTIGITILACASGIFSIKDLDIYNTILQILPLQMEHYWFVTAYIIMYMLSPVLAAGIKNISRKQLQIVILIFVCFMCVEKSIVPVRLIIDKKGYDALWLICLFLVAAYIRLYGIKFLQKKSIVILLYFLGCAMSFIENMAVALVYEKTGKLQHLIGVSYHYNHIFVFMASIGFFMFFLKINMPENKFSNIICKISPYTLGVYLLHEHLYIRYLWPKWFGAGDIQGPVMLVFKALLTVVTVFFIGVLVDYLRSLLFKLGSKLIHGKKSNKIA